MSSLIKDVKDPRNYLMILDKLKISSQIEKELYLTEILSQEIRDLQTEIDSKISSK